MELFIKVYFWISIVAFVVRIICISGDAYPRKITKTVDVIATIISMPFLLWAACLVW